MYFRHYRPECGQPAGGQQARPVAEHAVGRLGPVGAHGHQLGPGVGAVGGGGARGRAGGRCGGRRQEQGGLGRRQAQARAREASERLGQAGAAFEAAEAHDVSELEESRRVRALFLPN